MKPKCQTYQVTASQLLNRLHWMTVQVLRVTLATALLFSEFGTTLQAHPGLRHPVSTRSYQNMKYLPKFCIAVIASALHVSIASHSFAQNTAASRASMLTSTAWLKAHLHDANLVVLQVSSKAQYDSVHIPGAQQVALADITLAANESKLSLELPPPDRLKAWAEAHGISNTSRVVVVPFDTVLQSATRVFITLAYMGAMDRASLLNGGLAAWRAEGLPVTSEATTMPKPALFDLQLQPDIIAGMQDVERAVNDRTGSLIDARLSRFYDGDGGGYPRAGHIPTAISVPLNTVSDHGFLKDTTSLRKLFQNAGVLQGKPVVTYCHIGQQATLLWFVSTMLGYNTRMYDGSFQEWSGTDRLPVIGKPN